jgi:hypothetical protein
VTRLTSFVVPSVLYTRAPQLDEPPTGQTAEEAPLSSQEWPSWWEWDLGLSAHLLKRMVERDFTEVDLRRMLERATRLRLDFVDGRWIVETRHARRPWEVIVEPDEKIRLLVVITAYPVS